MADEDRLLTTTEAARAIGVSRGTLYRWWKGEGVVEPDSVTIGGQARWDLEDLRAQIRRHGRHEEGRKAR